MKTICFIGSRNIYLKRICNYLAGRDYQVHLISRDNTGIDPCEFDSRIHIYTLNSNRLHKKLPEIHRVIKKIKPDYIHFQSLTKDVLVGLFIFFKYKIILTPWGSDINIFANNLFNRIALNVGMLSCNKIQVLSEGIKKNLLKKFLFINKEKLVDLSWGVDFWQFHSVDQKQINYWRERLQLKPENIILLSYRNHKPLYNHHIILRALPLIIKKHPELNCVFTKGSAEQGYLEKNKRLVSELGLEKNVYFIEEWIQDEKLPALIQLADIVVSIPKFDGMPATLLEIMSTNAIPVVGDLPVYSSYFRDYENGRILKKMDEIDQLALLINEIIDDLDGYKVRCSENNNIYVRDYQNWELQKLKMETLYTF